MEVGLIYIGIGLRTESTGDEDVTCFFFRLLLTKRFSVIISGVELTLSFAIS